MTCLLRRPAHWARAELSVDGKRTKSSGYSCVARGHGSGCPLWLAQGVGERNRDLPGLSTPPSGTPRGDRTYRSRRRRLQRVACIMTTCRTPTESDSARRRSRERPPSEKSGVSLAINDARPGRRGSRRRPRKQTSQPTKTPRRPESLPAAMLRPRVAPARQPMHSSALASGGACI